MAAYAALVSLMNTLNNIQIHPRVSTFFYQEQIESLGEKLDFLLGVIESDNSDEGTSKGEDLESLIASAAYAAEDAIESHIADQILAGSSKESKESAISLLDLKKVIEDLDSVNVKVKEVKEEWRFKEEQLVYSKPANSSRPLTSVETRMVGFDNHFIHLLDKLTSQQRDLQIIPIVGMGGIGKTTLAKNAFEHPIIMEYFYLRAWVTVSQDFSLRQIYLGILSYLGESTSKLDGKSLDQLGDLLYMKLFGGRYLIVVDDMWRIDFWDEIRKFIPDNNIGSRIIVTTRLSNVAVQLGSSILELNFLDEDSSWELFCKKAFAETSCPLELEEVGRTIVQKCKGLPLAIVVIAGFLKKSSMTLDFWEKLAKDIISILTSETDNNLMRMLSLSYSHLPTHLKPCFLYMGVFSGDHEIRVSQLIKLWVAEGFIKSNSHESLEGIAEDYLQNLIGRNLVLDHSFGSNGKLKTCKMHDLLRDLCIRLAEKEKFLCVKKMFDSPQDKNLENRIIIQGSPAENSQLLHALESSPLVRTLICDSPIMISFKSRLLRVLIEVYGDSLDATFQQANLRFVSCKSICAPIGWIPAFELPSSISMLWNVQTFIIDKSIDKVVAPSEIWEMPQLRHLHFHRISLPDPPLANNQDCVLHNLQTLRTVLDFRCSEEVCRRMPNIRKLRIFYDDFSGDGEKSSQYGLYNVGNFQRLESLYCCFYAVPSRDDLLQNLKFPHSLKKLVLEDCELRWSDLSIIIGLLPMLEVLKLKHQSVRGSKWNPVEGDFQRLKYLEIDSCYLIHWNADDSSFPLLERVVLSNLYKLLEIPPSVAEIPTLLSICVVDCSISAAISAVKILEEQLEYGNEDLKVQVSFSEKMKLEEFNERVEAEGLPSTKLHIGGV